MVQNTGGVGSPLELESWHHTSTTLISPGRALAYPGKAPSSFASFM